MLDKDWSGAGAVEAAGIREPGTAPTVREAHIYTSLPPRGISFVER